MIHDNKTNLFTVTSVFKFRGGNVFSNPMVIYCQVRNRELYIQFVYTVYIVRGTGAFIDIDNGFAQ